MVVKSNHHSFKSSPIQLVLFTLLIVVAATGCSRSAGGPKRYGISGTVKLDGQPVKAGRITIEPVSGTRGPATGALIVDGEFEVPADKGPVDGEYVFQFDGDSDVVSDRETVRGIVIESHLPLFPAKYGIASTESRTVGPDSTHFDFDLSSK